MINKCYFCDNPAEEYYINCICNHTEEGCKQCYKKSKIHEANCLCSYCNAKFWNMMKEDRDTMIKKRCEKIKSLGYAAHVLKDGKVVAITSRHGFKFSDGTEALSGSEKLINVHRKFIAPPFDLPFPAYESIQTMDAQGLGALQELSEHADIVLVSYMTIAALKQLGIRIDFPKVVAFNPTEETSRCSNPSDKIVDVNKWGW